MNNKITGSKGKKEYTSGILKKDKIKEIITLVESNEKVLCSKAGMNAAKKHFKEQGKQLSSRMVTLDEAYSVWL